MDKSFKYFCEYIFHIKIFSDGFKARKNVKQNLKNIYHFNSNVQSFPL